MERTQSFEKPEYFGISEEERENAVESAGLPEDTTREELTEDYFRSWLAQKGAEYSKGKSEDELKNEFAESWADPEFRTSQYESRVKVTEKISEAHEKNTPTPEKKQGETPELSEDLKNIKDKLGEGFDELVIHGSDIFEDGKIVGVGLRPDLDSMMGVFLMDLANVDYKALTFVKKGESKEGAVNMDTGGREGVAIEDDTFFLDHHQSSKSAHDSATELIYETLVKIGMLEKEPWLDNMVKFVSEIDSLSYELNDKDKFKSEWWRTLYGIYKALPQDFIVDFFKSGKDPKEPFDLKEAETIKVGDKTLAEICRNNKKLVQISTSGIEKAEKKMKRKNVSGYSDELGKVLVNMMNVKEGEENVGQKNKIPIGFPAVKVFGYDSYVIWNEVEQSFFINSQTKDLTDIFDRVKAEFPDATIIREAMIIRRTEEKSDDFDLDKFIDLLGLKKPEEGEKSEELHSESKAEGPSKILQREMDIAKELNIELPEEKQKPDTELFEVKKEIAKRLGIEDIKSLEIADLIDVPTKWISSLIRKNNGETVNMSKKQEEWTNEIMEKLYLSQSPSDETESTEESEKGNKPDEEKEILIPNLDEYIEKVKSDLADGKQQKTSIDLPRNDLPFIKAFKDKLKKEGFIFGDTSMEPGKKGATVKGIQKIKPSK